MNRFDDRFATDRLTTEGQNKARVTRCPREKCQEGGLSSRDPLHIFASNRFERLLLAKLRALEGREPSPPRLVW
jgi:hypothetical protein